MTFDFSSVMVGSVVQCPNGRRLIKISPKSRQINAQDAEGREYTAPDNMQVVILKSSLKLAQAFLRAYDAREAELNR